MTPQAAARAALSIAGATGIEIDQVPSFLRSLWDAWCEHPDFRSYYTRDRFGYAPTPSILNVPAMGVYVHEEGTRGSESYYFSDLPDVIAAISWCKRSLGDFSYVAPLPANISPSRIRATFISNSPKGSGNAYESRMILKQMLPRSVHRWISRARTANYKPKYSYLQSTLPVPQTDEEVTRRRQMYRTPTLQPDWYRNSTKAELWLRDLVEQDPDAARIIESYMNLQDFWRCATGKIKSTEVAGLINHQICLPGI